jgi:hypothetical protein
MTSLTTPGLLRLAALLASTYLAAASAHASLVTLSDPTGNFSVSLDPSLGTWNYYGDDLSADSPLQNASISQGSLVFAQMFGLNAYDNAPQHQGAPSHSSLSFVVNFTPASGQAITGYDITYAGRYGVQDAYGGSPHTFTVNATGLSGPTSFALSETANQTFSLTRRVQAGNSLSLTATLDVSATSDHAPGADLSQGPAIDMAYMYGVIDTISIKPMLGTASVPISMVPESGGWQLALAGLGLLSGAFVMRCQRTRA